METDKTSKSSIAPATQQAAQLFVVLTPPSSLAVAVLHAVQAIADNALVSVDMIKLSTLEALRSEMTTRKNRHLLLYSDCPSPEAVDLITQAAPKVLVFADDPVRVAHSLQGKVGTDRISAIRTTALSFATLHDLILYASRKTILAPTDSVSLEAFLATVADFFSLPASARDISRIVDKFSALVDWTSASLEGVAKPFAGNGIVSPFASLFENKPADGFFWPPALFFGTEPLGSPLQKQIDLTGPARPILYGPYMHLPPGEWVATIRFTVSQNKSGNAILVEWMSGSVVEQSSRISALPEAGQFQFSLRIKITDPRAPLQIRLSILEGAIEGIFEFHGVELTRQATA